MKRAGYLCILLLVILAGCTRNPEYTGSAGGSSAAAEITFQKEETAQEAETMQKQLTLTVNNTVIPVIWEENPSVAELTEHAAGGAVQIEMRMYGGWEQVGSLGYSISRKDVQMTARTGDIMLYSGNQIVLFYGENAWAYTKLGHIALPEEEVTALLSSGAVRITLTVQ